MIEPPLVELVDVGKTYPNGAKALEGCSLSVRPGEFVSLLGPSGCGKSTALRLIAALTPPTEGVVRRAWDDDAATRSKPAPLACVFQEPTLMPWASTWENVYLPLRLQGVNKSATRDHVDQALELVGLTKFARAYPAELSGGMKMRTSVARALVTHPQLLLLDEPFAALDEITRGRLNDDLLALWRRQRWAVLFITHSVFESVYLSTRVLVMSPRPGRIVDEVTIDLPEVRTRETRASADYLALCNRLSSSLEATTISHGALAPGSETAHQ
jgi:NitT/TauT family transport system ATP-binding protein